MREFTKSVLRLPLAISLFGVEQVARTFGQRDPNQGINQSAATFNELTEATQEQLHGAFKEAFKAGDQVQRNVVDALFNALKCEDCNQVMKMPSDVVQRAAETIRQAMRKDRSG